MLTRHSQRTIYLQDGRIVSADDELDLVPAVAAAPSEGNGFHHDEDARSFLDSGKRRRKTKRDQS